MHTTWINVKKRLNAVYKFKEDDYDGIGNNFIEGLLQSSARLLSLKFRIVRIEFFERCSGMAIDRPAISKSSFILVETDFALLYVCVNEKNHHFFLFSHKWYDFPNLYFSNTFLHYSYFPQKCSIGHKKTTPKIFHS